MPTVWDLDISRTAWCSLPARPTTARRAVSTFDGLTHCGPTPGTWRTVDCVKFHPNSNYLATGLNRQDGAAVECPAGELPRDSSQATVAVRYPQPFHNGQYLVSAGGPC